MRPDRNFDKNLEMVGAMIEAGDAVLPTDMMMAKEVMACAREKLASLPIIKRCDTCIYYKEGNCDLVKQAPPDDVKVTGCEMWIDETTDPWNLPGHFEIGA